jgi:hypothetical protein
VRSRTVRRFGVWQYSGVDENVSERLRREAAELRETATDLMEHAALLITKSVEIDKLIGKSAKAPQNRKK